MDHKYLSYEGLKRFFYTKILKQINLKIDKTNGDISNTKVRSVETIETKFPIPSAGETIKRFLGKVVTFLTNIKPLEADVTYYVATTGDDSTGNGTSVKPYKTIKYALSMIPRDLGGYAATIFLADGTYDESVIINGYHSGVLSIMSQSSPEALNTVCKVRKTTINNCMARVQLYGLYFTQKDGETVVTMTCHMVYMRCCQAVESATTYIAFNFMHTKARVSGCRSINHMNCIRTFFSEVSSENWVDSSAVEYGLLSDVCGKISKTGIQPGGTKAPELKTSGGVIVSKYSALIGALQYNISLYVSPTGSDTANGGNVESSPFRTIKYALSTIPSDLGGYTATIYLADGEYDEEVNISGYHSGVINLKSASSPESLNTVCRVRRVIVNNCSAFIQLYGLYITQTDDVAFDMLVCSSIYIRCCQAIESATSSPAFNFRNTKARVSGCKCLNHSTGIKTIFSEINSESWAASSSTTIYGLHSDYGSKISKVGTQPSGGTSNEHTSNGGTIINANGGRLQGDKNVVTVTLTATGWTGSTAPYSQTVSITSVTEDMEAMLLSALEPDTTPAVADAYNIAFYNIIRGTASIGNGNATFKVYDKPATDIKVGLKAI